MPTSFFGEILEKTIKLRRHSALAAAADVVHHLVHEDEAGLILRQELADNIPGGSSHLLFVVSKDLDTFLATQLEGDLAPGGFAQRRTIVSPTTRDGIKLGPDEDCRGCLGH